jgi:ribosomal protein L34E
MSDNGKAIATRDSAALLEQVLVGGDLDKLTPAQRLDYVLKVCEATKLSPATRPFEYIRLSGKLVLYARKDATDQLRKIHNVSLVEIKEHDDAERGIHVVWATMRLPDGREDRDMGAVSTKGLSGDALVNALMKCVTKAKRRTTLSICGLGMLDETEIETIPQAEPVPASPRNTVEQTMCADCQKPIAGHKHGETFYRAADIAERTLKAYGRALCWECAEKASQPVEGETVAQAEF